MSGGAGGKQWVTGNARGKQGMSGGAGDKQRVTGGAGGKLWVTRQGLISREGKWDAQTMYLAISAEKVDITKNVLKVLFRVGGGGGGTSVGGRYPPFPPFCINHC